MGYVVKSACAMIKVGDTFVTVDKGGPVPLGADADHVKMLVERGMLVEGEFGGFETDPNIPPPFKAPKTPPASLDAFPVEGTDEEKAAWVAGASIPSIQAYVAEYPESAAEILGVEEARGDSARKTLVDALTKLTDGS